MAVESNVALSGTTSVDSAAIVPRTSRSARCRGSNTRSAKVRPGFSAPPNASRTGRSEVTTIGWVSPVRVVCESPADASVTVSTESPLTTTRALKRSASPS